MRESTGRNIETKRTLLVEVEKNNLPGTCPLKQSYFFVCRFLICKDLPGVCFAGLGCTKTFDFGYFVVHRVLFPE